MTKLDLPRYLKLRKMHDSLYLTVPREYVLAHTLSPHDDVYWLPEADGIKLRFNEPTDRGPSNPCDPAGTYLTSRHSTGAT
jgi:hypothetical protein